MPRLLLTAAVALAAAVAVPSVADAATLHQDGKRSHRVLLQDTAGDVNLISVQGSKHVLIQDANMPIEIDRVPWCMPVDAYTVSCSPWVQQIDMDLGGGPDVAVIESSKDIEIEGGTGRDRYVAGMTDGPSRVRYSGGIGLDTVNYGFATAGVGVAVDSDAADGRAGDDDQIFNDVEVVFGSQFDDVLTGGRHTLELDGRDGDDAITGGSGAESLQGGAGNDRIDARDGAADSIDCGGDLLDRATVDLGLEASITGCSEVF
jgi:hypothetical protein